MASFTYRATDARGEITKGVVQGLNLAQAKVALQRQGLFPLEVTERAPAATNGAGVGGSLRRLGSARAELPAFTRALASFLGAGFPLDRALGMYADLASHPRFDAAVKHVRREIQAGRSFAGALETEPGLFDPLYVSTVGAAERAGALEAALTSLADALEERRELRQQLQGILLYPALMACVGALAVAVLLIFVIPRFVDILEGGGAALPWATAALLGVSRVVTRFWWLLGLIAALVFALVHGYLNTSEGRRAWDRRKLRLPVAGILMRKLLAARFCRTLGTLLQNGVPLTNALRLTAETLGNTAAVQAVRDVHGRVKEGESLASALGRFDVFPPAVLRMIAVGEESGKPEDMLFRAAEFYEGETRRNLRTLVGLVEPALILLLGGVVGFVALAMIQAVFSINDVPL
jgi:type II secretory pathway component PulF